jgi:hypothetical protein
MEGKHSYWNSCLVIRLIFGVTTTIDDTMQAEVECPPL